MSRSYRNITPRLAGQIRLLMTDVDGTITPGGDSLSLAVLDAIKCLEGEGIMVGLVSGRMLSRLESMARDLGITGPIIAENGGVAKLKANSQLIDLGYSREPAIKALEKLKRLFPEAIQEREDNKYRLVDTVIISHGIEPKELRKYLEDAELLDSGYVLHLLQKGVSKGKTLTRVLGNLTNGSLSAAEVIVFGDSLTDLSLFQMFPNSVLITNPRLPAQERQVLRKFARYASALPPGDGFVEVALHILNARLNSNLKSKAN